MLNDLMGEEYAGRNMWRCRERLLNIVVVKFDETEF